MDISILKNTLLKRGENNEKQRTGREIIQVPVRSAIAHFYFESIHPFEDDEEHIGQVVAEKALAQETGAGPNGFTEGNDRR